MVLHSQTDMLPLINSHFSGGQHLFKQQVVLSFVQFSLYAIVAIPTSCI